MTGPVYPAARVSAPFRCVLIVICGLTGERTASSGEDEDNREERFDPQVGF